jgi:hypothetical protein
MLFELPAQNLLSNETLDTTNKKLDFLHGVQNAIDSFLSEINKIITQDLFPKHFSTEYYDEIYKDQILPNLCNAVTEIFYKEQNNCLLNCGKKFHIKSNKLCETHILSLLQTIINNKELYEEDYIIEINNDYNILRAYKYYYNISKNYDTYFHILYSTIDVSLKIIHENKIQRLNDIYININKINKIKNTIQLDNINNINNIALEIKELIDIVLINCVSICNFSKEFSKIIANKIQCLFYKEIYIQNVMYNKNIIIIIRERNNNIYEQLLAKEFEKIIESNEYKQYMDKIIMLHKYAIALSDKLEVICSI